MRIKEVCKLTGLSEKTIRYYESRGLVVPDMEERNGRQWRDYTQTHVELLRAVATLRRACFRVEEIDAIRRDPACIPETLEAVRERIEETYAALLRLRACMDSAAAAPDLMSLAQTLSPAAEPLELPPQDVKFNFKQFDKLMAAEQAEVDAAPQRHRIGWVEIYKGQDEGRFLEIQQKLSACGIEYRSSSYTKGNRLIVQGMTNNATIELTRGPTIRPYKLQENLLSDTSLDIYTVEVRKRNEERARRALRTTA